MVCQGFGRHRAPWHSLQTMYTIKEAAARSGVGESLLRAWYRRCVVHPSRTASGYRLYDDAAIARLHAMRALVQNGWAASQAAEAVMTGSAGLVVAAFEGPTGGGEGAAKPLVVAAMAYDTAGIEAAIDEVIARGSYESVVDDVLLPAVAALGTAWAAGRIDVAAEHLASAAVQRRLAALFDLGGRPGGGHPWSWVCHPAAATRSARSLSPSRCGGMASTSCTWARIPLSPPGPTSPWTVVPKPRSSAFPVGQMSGRRGRSSPRCTRAGRSSSSRSADPRQDGRPTMWSRSSRPGSQTRPRRSSASSGVGDGPTLRATARSGRGVQA